MATRRGWMIWLGLVLAVIVGVPLVAYVAGSFRTGTFSKPGFW